jgi:hypothetical protein
VLATLTPIIKVLPRLRCICLAHGFWQDLRGTRHQDRVPNVDGELPPNSQNATELKPPGTQSCRALPALSVSRTARPTQRSRVWLTTWVSWVWVRSRVGTFLDPEIGSCLVWTYPFQGPIQSFWPVPVPWSKRPNSWNVAISGPFSWDVPMIF